MAFEKTKVSTDRTQQEIANLLEAAGADDFVSGRSNSKGMAFIECKYKGRHLRFHVKMPDPEDFRLQPKRPGQRKQLERSPTQQRDYYEQACRQQWRRLKLLIVAKLEYVKDGSLEIFDTEFGGYQVMPNGYTVAEMLHPSLEAIAKGEKPPILALGGPVPLHLTDEGKK